MHAAEPQILTERAEDIIDADAPRYSERELTERVNAAQAAVRRATAGKIKALETELVEARAELASRPPLPELPAAMSAEQWEALKDRPVTECQYDELIKPHLPTRPLAEWLARDRRFQNQE